MSKLAEALARAVEIKDKLDAQAEPLGYTEHLRDLSRYIPLLVGGLEEAQEHARMERLQGWEEGAGGADKHHAERYAALEERELQAIARAEAAEGELAGWQQEHARLLDIWTQNSPAVAYKEELTKVRSEHQQVMQRIANAVGIDIPEQLIMRAKNNEQTLYDILVEYLAERWAALAQSEAELALSRTAGNLKGKLLLESEAEVARLRACLQFVLDYYERQAQCPLPAEYKQRVDVALSAARPEWR